MVSYFKLKDNSNKHEMCCVHRTLKVNKNYIVFVLKKKKKRKKRNKLNIANLSNFVRDVYHPNFKLKECRYEL